MESLSQSLSQKNSSTLNTKLDQEKERLEQLFRSKIQREKVENMVHSVQNTKIKAHANFLHFLKTGIELEDVQDYFSKQLQRANADFESNHKRDRDSMSADDTFSDFLSLQFKNARELALLKKELKQITKKNLEYFGRAGHIELQGCTDGRKISETVMGLNSIVKTAAGKIDITKDIKHKNRVLDRLQAISEKNQESLNDPTVCYTKILLSHTHCAAAKACARCIEDFGLLEDIEHKVTLRDQKLSIVEQMAEENNIPLKLSIFLATYDIEDGSMNVGMEKKENLALAKEKDGFQETTIKALEQEKKIFSTRSFVDTNTYGIRNLFQRIEKEWEKEKFTINFEDNYIKSMNKFADACLFLKHTGIADSQGNERPVLDVIQSELEAIYPITVEIVETDTEKEKKEKRKEIEMQKNELRKLTKVLLRNALSYYLFNYKDGKKHGNYPYKDHKEPLILIHDGLVVPQPNNPFHLSQYNDQNGDYLLFLSKIIFDNRAKRKTILDTANAYEGNLDAFAESPINVPIFRYTKQRVPNHIVEKLNLLSTDFSDHNFVRSLGDMTTYTDKKGITYEAPLWYVMGDEEFKVFLHKKCEGIRQVFTDFPEDLSKDLVRSLNKLRKLCRKFYKNPELREKILSGKVRLRPCITTKTGLPLIYFPFQECMKVKKD